MGELRKKETGKDTEEGKRWWGELRKEETGKDTEEGKR
jgi:hypothetical protein